jgi:hypothetical protein
MNSFNKYFRCSSLNNNSPAKELIDAVVEGGKSEIRICGLLKPGHYWV